MVIAFVFTSNCFAHFRCAFQEVAYLPADGKRWRNSSFCFAYELSFCFCYCTVFIFIYESSCLLYIFSCLQGRWVSGWLAVGWSQPTTVRLYTLLIFNSLAIHNSRYAAIEEKVVSHFDLAEWHMVYIFPVWVTFIFM